jgi:transcriptional regulatory protein GAL4
MDSAGQDVFGFPSMIADQACKECRRRKAKCNRGIPTCSLCIKYNRHCLYEKHSKTPLTRKWVYHLPLWWQILISCRHLTDVEERLERAEALLRKARLMPQSRAAPPSDSMPEPSTTVNEPKNAFDFSNLDDPIPTSTNMGFMSSLTPFTADVQTSFLNVDLGHVNTDAFTDALPGSGETSTGLNVHEYYQNGNDENQNPTNPLECPPTDDFEWDEQHVSVMEQADQDLSSWASRSSDHEDTEDNVIDGMASLTVNEKEGGYLGVASGAALLRIIDPLPPTRRNATGSRPRVERLPSESAAMVQSLYEQPNPNRHIRDSMIDAYFRLYHLSYPIVHEPTFRAQYSEIIPRPNGDCWLILAYIIAAIGVFTTAKSLDGTDLPLFAQAKAMLSINFLEAGNLTLVQALTLISNYQQKRNKPNSGYNYLGLAQRMAMGLGLHKEFQGWNISPLKMEIRRRVWWSLCVFDVGATITFSRPMAWPGEGIEVAFPMNVNDRVSIFAYSPTTILTAIAGTHGSIPELSFRK